MAKTQCGKLRCLWKTPHCFHSIFRQKNICTTAVRKNKIIELHYTRYSHRSDVFCTVHNIPTPYGNSCIYTRTAAVHLFRLRHSNTRTLIFRVCSAHTIYRGIGIRAVVVGTYIGYTTADGLFRHTLASCTTTYGAQVPGIWYIINVHCTIIYISVNVSICAPHFIVIFLKALIRTRGISGQFGARIYTRARAHRFAIALRQSS